MFTPIIGSRFIIRKLKRSDAPEIYKYAKHKDLARFTTLPHPYKLSHAKYFVNMTLRKIRNKQSFEVGIILKETNRLVGMIGLTNLDYTNKTAEIGYWLGKPYWGKKIMSEAVNLLLHFGFKKQKFNRIYAKVMEANKPSQGLLKKHRFIHEGIERKGIFRNNRYSDVILLSLLNSEYKK